MARKAFVLLEMMNAMLLVAQEAKRRGYAVIALNHDPLQNAGPFAVGDGVVDELIPVESWSDQAALRPLIEDLVSRYEVAGTYSVFEPTLGTESCLRALVGLPTTSVDNTLRVLDKARVRAKLFDEGLTKLRSATLDEALSWQSWPWDGPAVVKPANGTGSALCFMVSTLQELHAAAAHAVSAAVVNPLMREYIVSHGKFVVEQLAEGELLSVESLVDRGEVHVVGLTGRYLLGSDPIVEQGLFFPYQHPLLAEITAKSEALHASLEIGHGATHLEVMVAADGQIELIDFNPRFAGFASAVSFSEAFGIPFESVLTDLACGIAPNLSFLQNRRRYAAEMVVLPAPGTVELRSIAFPAGTIAARATKRLGQSLSGRADQLDAVGMFIVVGDTPGQAQDAALLARRETVVNGQALGDNPNNVVVCPKHVRAEPAFQSLQVR